VLPDRAICAAVHDPPVDDRGYLVGVSALALTGTQADGERRTIFSRGALEAALWSYGEDDFLETVRAGLTAEQVRAIGTIDCRLTYTADPDSKSGRGYSFDRALAMAAVEVLGGAPRPLARKRRRPKQP
jgi:hypothetical protein